MDFSRHAWSRRAGVLLLAAAVGACGPSGPPPPATITAPSAIATRVPTVTSTGFALPAATETSECAPSDVLVEEAAYSGVAVRTQVPVVFFVPDCTGSSVGPLPIIFLLHGKPMTEQQWLDLDLPALLREGWQAQRWPPMVLVAARQPEPLFSNTDGGSGSYEQEFLEGLIPFVESSQPVEGEAGRRAVLGISRGGVWALEIAMTHPGEVGAVAALSPALAVNYARPAYNPFELVTAMTDFPRLYLGAGVDDWARTSTERLARSLEAAQADFRLDVVPGGHDEGTWKALLPAALDFIASAWGDGWGDSGDRSGGGPAEIR